MTCQLLNGNNLELLKKLPDNSVDAVATDPPYGLGKEPDAFAMLRDWIETGHHDVKSKNGFMGKAWDNFVPQPVQWREVFRVLKPGGHVLAFAGTRTQDLMSLGLRLAGFEIRDLVAWVYGSGFPKSHNLEGGWEGWGTALKPALEPITLARKPLEGTVADNVLKWHTGAINVDACRVGHVTVEGGNLALNPHLRSHINGGNGGNIIAHEEERRVVTPNQAGRWPANLIHDGSEEVLAGFPAQAGASGRASGPTLRNGSGRKAKAGSFNGTNAVQQLYGDSGSAARFFYCAKTNSTDRNEGCDELDDSFIAASNQAQAQLKRGVTEYKAASGTNSIKSVKNNHPTVKPTSLMRYLCRLITPPGGTVLDPWMGSGSTGKACGAEGFNFIGMEMDEKYFTIAQARVSAAYPNEDFC